jgi:beta-glucosidase
MIKSGINGVQDATAIPSQINVAATWSRLMAKAAGHVTGLEARLLKAGKLSPGQPILGFKLTS